MSYNIIEKSFKIVFQHDFGSSKHICTPKFNICNLWFILIEQTWIRNKIK
jgi:hypothetical protein